MDRQKQYVQLAQSASALGAALLGFGIGAKWGARMNSAIVIAILVIGGIIHVGGMYVMQMKKEEKAGPLAKLLWVTAWICLLSVVILFVYLVFTRDQL